MLNRSTCFVCFSIFFFLFCFLFFFCFVVNLVKEERKNWDYSKACKSKPEWGETENTERKNSIARFPWCSHMIVQAYMTSIHLRGKIVFSSNQNQSDFNFCPLQKTDSLSCEVWHPKSRVATFQNKQRQTWIRNNVTFSFPHRHIISVIPQVYTNTLMYQE